MSILVWFRDDLRSDDNRALQAAITEADNNGVDVIAVWCHAPRQWDEHGIGNNRRWFTLSCVKELAVTLAQHGIPLHVLEAGDFTGSVQKLLAFATTHAVTAIHCNREYPLHETARDNTLAGQAAQAGISFTRHEDSMLVAPEALTTGSGKPYIKFTPYRQAWYREVLHHSNWMPALFKAPVVPANPQQVTAILSATLPVLSKHCAALAVSATVTAQWQPGAEAAQALLTRFVEDHIVHYQEQRDIPALAATSSLSPYLACGAISIRRLLVAAMEKNRGQIAEGNAGVVTWISELCWRDFYRQIMANFPHVAMGRAFRRDTDRIAWRHDERDFRAWCEGRTGFPLVDAAMRQLNATGWMHNRLRMVAAMFLTKDLLIDWRWGERYFLQQLVDADFAANNGGWQWSASTGTDAVPYFRLFNPLRQAERFDADGSFVREWLGDKTPVLPIVNHAFAKQRVLAAFGQLRNEVA